MPTAMLDAARRASSTLEPERASTTDRRPARAGAARTTARHRARPRATRPWTPPTPPPSPRRDGERRRSFAAIRARRPAAAPPVRLVPDSVELRPRRPPTIRTCSRSRDPLPHRRRLADHARAWSRAAEAASRSPSLVELKARFDEERNIHWARALERRRRPRHLRLVGLKTHAKIVLVVRREGDAIRRYVHIGTGNYNAHTARLYTDLGLFTRRPRARRGRERALQPPDRLLAAVATTASCSSRPYGLRDALAWLHRARGRARARRRPRASSLKMNASSTRR